MRKDWETYMAKIPKELKLILELLTNTNNHSLSKGMIHDIDWDLFLTLAVHHRLYPLLYPNISKLGHVIPTTVIESLENYYRRNTFKMLHLCAEMEKLNAFFVTNNIRALFLKGPVLATDLYGEISKRTSGDLDILIPMADLEKTNRLLEEMGYEKDEYIETVLNDWKWRHHHFTYYHPMEGTKVEIHWRLNPAPSKEPPFNELWDRRRESLITNTPISMLSMEDLFFFLVTHGARHGWSRLRWLMDIHQLTQKELDWPKLHTLLKQYECYHIGGQAVLLATQLLRTPVINEMKPLLKGKIPQRLAKEAFFYLERMVNLHTDPVPKEIAKYHTNHLFALMSYRQKLVYIFSMLHPYYTDVETLPLPKQLHFLYFPLRPFLWAWRKTRKPAI